MIGSERAASKAVSIGYEPLAVTDKPVLHSSAILAQMCFYESVIKCDPTHSRPFTALGTS